MKYYISYLFIVTLLSSCSFSQKIKDGEMAYERKQFSVAIDLLNKEYNDTKLEQVRARKAYLLGRSYLQLLEYSSSKSWFEKSVNHQYGPEALSLLAKVAKSMEEYNTAIETYRKLGEITGRKQETDSEILLCKQAIDYKSRKPQYQIERLFENSSVSDYSPALFDDQYIVFTSERIEATGSGVYKWTGERFSDIFIIQKNGSEVRRFDSAINSEHNDGAPCFTKDYKKIYFTRCFSDNSGDSFCKIMYSQRNNGIWDEPEVMPFTLDKINYGQAALIENDSVIVFSADISEPGGQLDLYYSELIDLGTWSVPQKMPGSISTQGNEKFPTSDGDTLYFSSDFLPGLGGFDIFKTYLRSDGSWASPFNLGYPINSGGDDFSFIIDYNARKKNNVVQQGLFSSSRNGSGKDDIFRFSKFKEEEVIKSVPDKTKELFLTVKAYTPSYEIKDDPNSKVVGKLPLGEAFIKVNTGDTKIKEAYADLNGFFLTEIPLDQTIIIIGAKLGYLNASYEVDSKNIDFKDGETSKTINVELLLNKIYSEKEINLANIYYDFDKWDIKDQAKPTLDELTKILNDNPQINIQLSSHTDCRGIEEYNETLSQKRAQSVVDYLINDGISPERLIAKGYGESQLLDKCECEICTEEQHQTNRRTTFKILKR